MHERDAGRALVDGEPMSALCFRCGETDALTEALHRSQGNQGRSTSVISSPGYREIEHGCDQRSQTEEPLGAIALSEPSAGYARDYVAVVKSSKDQALGVNVPIEWTALEEIRVNSVSTCRKINSADSSG